jgi:hypothetical protein
MLARLWWKEARLIWPIAAFLAIVSIAVQWLALYYLGKDARTGGLTILALGWTCLYAFAVASASLAGEQENRTLLLLDALPVERWRLWAAKVSFAMGSTLLLGALLAGYAYLYTDSTEQMPVAAKRYPILGGLVILFQALGWGLFWSAASSQALTAAVLAVCSAGLVMPLLDVGLNLRLESAGDVLAALGLVAATILGSAFLFIRSGPPNRPLLPAGRRLHRERVITSYEEARRIRQRPPRTWPRAGWSLAWQALRELGGLWWKLALIALFLPILLLFWTSGRIGYEPALLVLFGVGVGILAGVNVLGTESGVRSRQFLAHHAVRPGMIWLVRTAVWLAALVPLWIPSLLAALFIRPLGPAYGYGVSIFAGEAAILLGCFAVGLLCGITIRRGITAGLVALVILIAGAVPIGSLLAMGLAPAWVAVAIPLVILAASWAWSGDWLLGLPGAWKWVKLALLLLGGLAAVFGLYVYDRSMTPPTLDAVTSARMFQFTTARGALAPGENAASLYREAIKELRPNAAARTDVLKEIIQEGWGSKGREDAAVVAQREQVLRLVRQAAALPGCRFVPVETLTEFKAPDPGLESCLTFVPLLVISARDRMARGDLDGAWDEVAVIFRVAWHWSGAVPLIQAHQGQAAERWGLSLALLWAADPRQTPESLARALDAYRKLPEMPPAAETIRAEALISRNTGALPRDELVAQFFRWRIEPPNVPTASEKLWVDFLTPPWELARARKVFPLLYASKIAEAERPPWRRNDESLRHDSWNGFQARFGDPSSTVSGYELSNLFETTPLAKLTFANTDGFLTSWDRNWVCRRAVLQVLALHLWQVRHDGHLPTNLAELVPSILESLPDDPYNTPGQAFGYVRSSGQALLPLGDLEPLVASYNSSRVRPVEDSWLLYSIGPDLRDDRAQLNDSSHVAKGDIIFPLPERRPTPQQKGG